MAALSCQWQQRYHAPSFFRKLWQLFRPPHAPITPTPQPSPQRPSQKREAPSECGPPLQTPSKPARKRQKGGTTVVTTEDYDKEVPPALLRIKDAPQLLGIFVRLNPIYT